MALSLDLLNLICTIPQTDMLDVTGTAPSEIRELNIDVFRKAFGSLMDDEPNVDTVWPFEWTQPKILGGVTYAGLLEIINGWTVQFSDAAYNVNIVGGNSNLSDVIIKNTVGVNTANSAGLQDAYSLQAGAYGGVVAIDVGATQSGTTFPFGTRGQPVNNLADAKAIADARGMNTFAIMSSMTLATETFTDAVVFVGDSATTVVMTIDPSVTITNSEFQNLYVTGTLDGNNTFKQCVVGDITFFDGFIFESALVGTIVLSGNNQSNIFSSYSGVAGGGAGAYPVIDMGGVGATKLAIRDFHGGLGIENNTDAAAVGSIDMASGRVVFDPDVIAGSFWVRGVADVFDASTGTAVVNDLTVVAETSGAIIPHIWAAAP